MLCCIVLYCAAPLAFDNAIAIVFSWLQVRDNSTQMRDPTPDPTPDPKAVLANLIDVDSVTIISILLLSYYYHLLLS